MFKTCILIDEELLQTAAGLLAVHVMGKMKSGDTGSLSLSLIEKIHTLLKKV